MIAAGREGDYLAVRNSQSQLDAPHPHNLGSRGSKSQLAAMNHYDL